MKKTATHTIRVRASAGDYAVVCGYGLVRNLRRELGRVGEFSSLHVLSSPKVWRALGPSVRAGLGRPVNVHLFGDAESLKNMASVEGIARKLVRAGADRRALLVAVGGGVVGDVAGFVAASYLRGVALAHVPTTLVAQVDSAIGGKTGVNLPEGKNLVGAFHPPRIVLVDPQALATLPAREFRGGLAEVIKYGVIADARLFEFLEKNMQKILERDPVALEFVIRRCVAIKADVVSRDERESGLREILNFGHTFGHVLESLTGYKRFQHGEAVAWGMMCAALLGHEAAGTKPDTVARIVALVRQIGPLPRWPKMTPRSMVETMRSDKKSRAGKIRFVLASRLGHARSYDDVPETIVLRVLRCAPECLVNSHAMTGKRDA